MVEITSSKNPKIKELMELYNKKNRITAKKFLVEGYHLVDEANICKKLDYIVTKNVDDFKKYNVDGYLVNDDIIKKLSTTVNSQGIIGVVNMKNEFDTNNIIKKGVNFVVLDNVNDPGNLGTIIRTSAALGVDAIFVSSDTVDVYNDKVLRSTQGTIFKIPVIKTDLAKLISLLKNNNVYIYATALDAKKSLKDVKRKEKIALVFGNEANGISDDIKSLVDEKILIPMANKVESLNVAIACAICIYTLI